MQFETVSCFRKYISKHLIVSLQPPCKEGNIDVLICTSNREEQRSYVACPSY